MRLFALTLLAAGPLAAAPVEPSLDRETGLATWETGTASVQVRLTQISPDQARAFYQARGFSAAAAEHYATECVFMTVVRNVGEVPVEHRLADWRYAVPGGRAYAIRSKSAWERQWQRLGVTDAARIAFNWAQFPATQTFAPGDWNQGMTSYRVPRGGAFDLRVVWRAGGKSHSATLEKVKCADENS